MSSMLEQAIVDAKALKEAAIKNAEKEVLDKYNTANMYSDSVRERITSEIRDKLKEMVIDTPNDMELGGKIRCEIMNEDE